MMKDKKASPSRSCSSRRRYLLLVLTAVWMLAMSTPVAAGRGRPSRSKASSNVKRRSRGLKKDGSDTSEPTPLPSRSPTEMPSFGPTEGISNAPTNSPVATTVSPSLSGTPVAILQSTVAPSRLEESEVSTDLPSITPTLPTVVDLYPFSLTVAGVRNRDILLQDLEDFLLSSMKEEIPTLQNILLTPAPLDFGNGRTLQQGTRLGYDGTAVLSSKDSQGGLTVEELRRVQLETMQSSGDNSLKYYLENSTSQPVTLVQLQVANFDPVVFDEQDLGGEVSELNRGTEGDTGDGDQPKAGIIIGIVLGIIVVGTLIGCLTWRIFDKPPPPPPYELGHNEKDVSVDDIVEIGPSFKVASTPSTVHSDENQTIAKNHDGMAIDLSKPAKNSKGIGAVQKEIEAPKSAAKSMPPNGQGYETESSYDNTMDIHTMPSNDDDSMAGFSLALESPEPETTVKDPTSRRLLDTIVQERAAARAARAPSPTIENSAQMKYLSDPPKPQPHSAPPLRAGKNQQTTRGLVPYQQFVSDVESDSDRDDANVYVEDEDDEVEVSSRASSYKEDGGSVFSGVVSSDSDREEGESTTPMQGALGYFYREQDEAFQEDYDPLPKRLVGRSNYVPPDDASEVPFDERSDIGSNEENLNGFSQSDNLQKELDRLTCTSPTRTSPTQDITHLMPEDGKWEENPELMEAWLRERRRVKREARNRREDRKQPPLTMEV